MVTSGGNVGINDNTPDEAKLVVRGDANTNALAVGGNSTTGQSYGTLITAGTNSSDAAFRVYDQAGSTPYMFVRGDGNVGIGTTSPSSLTTLSKSSGNTILELNRSSTNTTGAVGTINFTASDGHSVANIHALGDGNNEGAHLIFKTTSAAGENDPYGSNTFERMRIRSDGGITFNGDTAAANALDDYEEGTWTPGINGVSYATADGHYIKIGNKVHCIGVLVNASSTVTTACNALFTGLPFTVASDNLSATSIEGSGFFHYWGNVGVAVSGINLAPMQNTTTCNVYYVPAGGVASGNISTSNRQHFDASNVSLRFNITYFTD